MAVKIMKQVSIEEPVFKRLQALATPLVDDTSAVIRKLLDHWEKKPPGGSRGGDDPGPEVCMLARGERMPVGLKLRANYRRRMFNAEVAKGGIAFEGELYDNPSAPGIRAKQMAGARANTASTNGWKFWEFFDPDSQSWRSIDEFRRR